MINPDACLNVMEQLQETAVAIARLDQLVLQYPDVPSVALSRRFIMKRYTVLQQRLLEFTQEEAHAGFGPR